MHHKDRLRKYLNEQELRVVKTRQVVDILGISSVTACRVLDTLVATGELVRAKRGLYVRRDCSPYELTAYVNGPHPSYVSMQSALAYHGIYDQLPTVVTAMTTGPSRVFRTPLGQIETHQIHPRLFYGFNQTDNSYVATKEKAFLDLTYIWMKKGLRQIPEVDLEQMGRKRLCQYASDFDQKFQSYIAQAGVPARLM